MRFIPFAVGVVFAVLAVLAVVLLSPWWLLAAVPLVLLAGLGTHDVLQTRHAILRNYPILGHGRFLMEAIRPEIQQYFIERDTDGTPYPRADRAVVYARAKLENEEVAFGTELDVLAEGYE